MAVNPTVSSLYYAKGGRRGIGVDSPDDAAVRYANNARVLVCTERHHPSEVGPSRDLVSGHQPPLGPQGAARVLWPNLSFLVVFPRESRIVLQFRHPPARCRMIVHRVQLPLAGIEIPSVRRRVMHKRTGRF